MPMPAEIEMRHAITVRDKSFDGKFFYGVITTGIFCQPSCSARPARPENLRFFSSVNLAVSSGFRPCKRCNPALGNSKIEKLIELIHYIERNAHEKMTLTSLGEIIGLSPSRLQRVFKATFGVSPKTYQDALRMRHFKKSLKEGEAVTDAIYSSGFGSISRVYGESARSIGMAPKKYRAGAVDEIITYAYRETSIGLMMMAATDKGVCFVHFDENKNAILTQLKQEFPNAKFILSASQETPELDDWIDALEQHISQGAPRPDLPLDIRGTIFQIKVWNFLLSIKEGDTLNYRDVAQNIDNPKAVRAVGSACGKNRISILIPCHRVLRSDGGLGGYRWGLERKQALLNKERTR